MLTRIVVSLSDVDHPKESLKLINNSGQHVFFKIKTTAPKRYSVKPNSGRVDPGATVSVESMLFVAHVIGSWEYTST